MPRFATLSVIITKNGRPSTVLLAYEDFVRLSKRDRRIDLTAELSADEIAVVEAAEMEPGHLTISTASFLRQRSDRWKNALRLFRALG